MSRIIKTINNDANIRLRFVVTSKSVFTPKQFVSSAHAAAASWMWVRMNPTGRPISRKSQDIAMARAAAEEKGERASYRDFRKELGLG
jgi:hypothetical protein